MRDVFRPWGRFAWILDNIDADYWSFIGAVSTEDRCITALEILTQRNARENSLIFRIEDAPSRFFNEVERRTDINTTKLKALGITDTEIRHHRLSGRHGEAVQATYNFLSQHNPRNLILDISSLPKKFFFIFLRKALEFPPDLQNIIITYTEPQGYCADPLAENPEAWNPLPGFLPPISEPTDKVLVIGLGYEPLGLPELYSSGLFNNARIRLLFPFPAEPASVARNWDFARLLEPVPGNTSTHIERVDSHNVPDTFDKLVTLSNQGQTYTVLAPFGPKPMSLAMCLFASGYSGRNNSPSVFYTQPTVYNPDYSRGVKEVDGSPSVNAYCIRLNGVNLYGRPQ